MSIYTLCLYGNLLAPSCVCVHVCSPSPRPLEYPDKEESADSDVAETTELDIPDRPEAGLENRPLHPSSNQEEPDFGLTFFLAVDQEILLLITKEALHIHAQHC